VLGPLVSALVLAAAPVPAWIQRAVPAPIVAWREADVLGSRLPEGVAVSRAGGTYFVGIVDSRLDPPEEVLEYDLAPAVAGSRVRTLVAGRFLGGGKAAIAVAVSAAERERAWVLRVERGRLRLVRGFAAERITFSGRSVALRLAGRPVERWRWERGVYRPIRP
jgi:hypothetical protein